MRHLPEAYTAGSFEEMDLVMQDSYPAWQETLGALDLLRDARACAARSSKSEAEEWAKTDKNKRTAKEILSDVSVNRIWGYLGFAIENGSYLGPPQDRPSERYHREAVEAWNEAMAEENNGGDRNDKVVRVIFA